MGVSKVIINGVTRVDLTQDTVASNNLLSGETATGADGEAVVGAIVSKASTDLTVSGATVTAPAGFYSAAASKSVATTTHPNPTASINSSTGVVTASHTQTTGYVTGGTTTGTLNLTTQAAKTVTPSTSSQTAVASGVYTTGAITVAAMPSGTAGTPTATKGTVSNHAVTVTPSVTNTTGYITGGTKSGTAVTVNVAELESGTKSITENGTGISVSGYSTVDVDVSGSDDLFAIRDDGKTHAWYYSPSDGTTVSIETSGYIVDWGDGESDYTTSSPKTHMYQKRGIYDIIIEPAPNQSNLYLRFGTESVGSNNLPYISHLLMVEISEDVLISASYAFAFVPSLTKVVAPRGYSTSLTNPSREFSNCVSLVYVDLPVGLQNVADYMFYENNNLKSIDLPNSITTIGRQSFYRCINLTSITIPENVTQIGDQAFVYCNKIAEYHLKPTTPPTLANTNAFPSLPSNRVIYVPTGSLSAYQTATNWSNFASIMQEE